jgi:hypothetical protein
MKCGYAIGQQDGALEQFQKCVEILRAELEAELMPKTPELDE